MQLPVHTDMSGNIPWSGIPAFRLINCQLGQVRELINQQLTTAAKARDIKPLLDYVNSRTGKLIRPGLVLLSYRIVRDASPGKKAQSDIRDTQYEAIRVAAIVEMIHNATLLHDDVIDDGKRRRGQPTINSLWGNEYAVLLGDFVLSRVFKMCACLDPHVADIVATTAVRVCEGELKQVVERQNWRLSEAEYIDIITEKSASFFSGCCRLGALLARGDDGQVLSLARYGLDVGIAFQIIDDLLDITADESQTGKTAGSDFDKNKLTLAVIHLLRTVAEDERPLVESKLSTKAELRDDLAKMLKFHGCMEYAHRQAQEYAAKAISALDDLADSDGKKALIETAKFLARRMV